MKKKILFFGIAVAASALVGGLTAYGVSKSISNDSFALIERADQQAGTHFTSYEKEKYPDLTYAAENAVKAVVNIEKIEEVKPRYSGG